MNTDKSSHKKTEPSLESLFGDVIYAYSRKQAIEDGVLIDSSKTAKEAGFRWPFAMTAEVWAMIEDIPEKHSHEDIQGRLWDVLMLARVAITKAGRNVELVFYDVILHTSQGDRVRVKLHCGPGDDGKPVLTLMLPNQD